MKMKMTAGTPPLHTSRLPPVITTMSKVKLGFDFFRDSGSGEKALTFEDGGAIGGGRSVRRRNGPNGVGVLLFQSRCQGSRFSVFGHRRTGE
jgi:hypothetical protein